MDERDSRTGGENGSADVMSRPAPTGSTIPPAASQNDALKEALDLAQSVGEREEVRRNSSGLGLASFDDSVSLNEYIDEAERRSRTIFDSPSFGDEGPVEDLDVLNIAAEFGRPDDSIESEEADFSDISIIPPAPLINEDTKDLKSPSIAPPEMETHSSIPPRRSISAAPSVSRTRAISRLGNSVPVRGERAEGSSPETGDKPTVQPAAFGGLKIGNKRHWQAAYSEIPLWKVLAAAYHEGFCGQCLVVVKDTRIEILLDGGYVVAAVADTSEADFAAFVAREAGLPPEDEDAVRVAARTGGARDSLAAAGIRRPEINRMTRAHAENLVRLATASSVGEWRLILAEGPVTLPDAPVETPTIAIVLRGIADSLSSEDAEEIAPLDSVLLPVDSPQATLSELMLTAEERCAAAMWNETVLLRDVLSECREDAGLHPLAAALVQLGCFEVRQPDPNRLRQRPDARDVVQDGDMLRRLSEKLEKIQKGTYYEILEVSPDDDIEKLVRAKERLTAYYDDKRFSSVGLAGHDAELQLVRHTVEEAFRVLENPSRRLRYRRAVAAQAMDD